MPRGKRLEPALVVVHDIAASWTMYESRAPTPGLVFHAAGPTDEGFRMIDIWTSDEAYERDRRAQNDLLSGDLVVPPVVRTLRVRAWLDPGATSSRRV